MEAEKQSHLLQRIAHTVREVEPSARIYLFGSRARGDYGPESDWDLIIILPGEVDESRKDRVRHHLYPVEWDEGEVLSARIVSNALWSSEEYRAMPLFQAVREEGIAV